MKEFKKRKKGIIALTKIVTWTIILISFFLIAFTVERIVSKSGPLESEIICRDSLILKSKTQFDFRVKEVSTPALCQTIDKKFSSVKKEESLDFFARSMERCWWMFLEGKVSEVFGSKGLLELEGGKAKCFVCNTLAYRKGPTITKTELLSHLQELKSKYKNSDVLSYVQERGYIKLYEDAYPSEQIYALVFASNIEREWVVPGILDIKPDEMKQNGVWLVELNKITDNDLCYYQPDIAGQ